MIHRITVKNFKSLANVSVELGRRNVAVGPNMSGKSTFISLFRFLRAMVLPAPGVYGLPSAVAQMGGIEELAWRGGDSPLISLALEGDFTRIAAFPGASRWRYEIDFASEAKTTPRIQHEALTFIGPSPEISLIQKDPSTGYRRIVSPQRGIVTDVRDAERSALEFEIPDWEGNAIRTLFASFRFYNLVPAFMKQVNTTAVAPFLDESGSNLSSWLLLLQTRYPAAFEKINLASRHTLSGLVELFTYPTPQATVFLASREDSLKTAIPIWHMSDGELSFIAWLSLLFCPPELQAPTYFIEEPENHLHPRLLEVLLELLDQVQMGPDSSQVFATTHSLVVVDRTPLDDLIVFERREGQTLCTRPRDRDHLRELVSRRDLGLGDLYYSGALGPA